MAEFHPFVGVPGVRSPTKGLWRARGEGPKVRGAMVHESSRVPSVVPLQASERDANQLAEVSARARRLLVAYADTLDLVEQLPAAPMVSTGWRWWGRGSRPIRLPRLSWMVRPLLVWHVDRVLTGAARVFHRRVAVGQASPAEADALHAIEEFRSSLPPRSKAFGFGVVAVLTVLLAQGLAKLLPQHLPTGLPLGRQTAQLFNATVGTFEPSAHSVASVANGLLSASPAALAAAAALLVLASYLVLRPVACAFRLKRLLLNLYPNAEALRRTAPASWSVSRSVGVYSLETEVFASAGVRPPSEPPLDLLVSLPIPMILVGALLGVIAVEHTSSFSSKLLNVGFAFVIYGLPGVLRLAWLGAVWRARRGGHRSSWLFAEDVEVPWGKKRLRGHSPLLIGWLTSFGWWACPWLWWSAARDLRAIGRVHEVKRLSRSRPIAQAVLICAFPFFLVPLVRAPRLIREAQVAVGIRRPVSRHLAWLAPLWPVLCVLLQRELNRLWRAEGHLAAVGRPDTSSDLPLLLETARSG